LDHPPSTIDHPPSSPLPIADRIMNHTLFLGTYPGLTVAQIDYMVKVIRDFVEAKRAASC
jgi:dTDP-4-amino-4,6-dideoxygalactose transaminase